MELVLLRFEFEVYTQGGFQPAQMLRPVFQFLMDGDGFESGEGICTSALDQLHQMSAPGGGELDTCASEKGYFFGIPKLPLNRGEEEIEVLRESGLQQVESRSGILGGPARRCLWSGGLQQSLDQFGSLNLVAN